MAQQKVSAIQNPSTGSYTVQVPKSAATGKFVASAPKPGRIQVLKAGKAAAKRSAS